MIKSYKLVYSPTSDKRFRYKVKINGNDADCMNVIKHIGPICGRPFKSLDSEFQKAFYVYGSSTSEKEQISHIIEEYLKKETLPSASADSVFAPLPKPSVEKPESEAGRFAATIGYKEGRFAEVSPPPEAPAELIEKPKEKPKEKREAVNVLEKLGIPPLNQRYQFSNLYEGSFNRFLKQACQDIAREFTPKYNPLFIWGGVGLGKTHLIQAIGNFIKRNHRDKKVLYIQAQDLMSMIQRVENSPTNKTELINDFSEAYALLIDDVQFLEGDTSQDVFFLIFERAYHKNNQIIITADRSPKKLIQITDRLQSRFEWGLVNKIQKPDLEEREGILKMKIEQDFSELELDNDMLIYVAKKFKNNIRELEGVLNKVNIYKSLTQKEITMDLLKSIVTELLGEESAEPTEKEERPPQATADAQRTCDKFAPAQESKVKGDLPAKDKKEKPSQTPVFPASSSDVSEESEPPPGPPGDFPPPPPETQCPNCGSELSYLEMYDRWYCYSCKRYAPPDFGKGKFGHVMRPKKKKNEAEDKEKLAALEELRRLAASQSKEPIKVIDEEKKEIQSKEEKEEPLKTPMPHPKPSVKVEYTRQIQCAIFFPKGSETDAQTAVKFVHSTVEKHRLHIKFEFVIQQDYNPQKLNYTSFINMLNTAKIKVAIVIGPPKAAKINEDEFYEKLNSMFVDEGLCFEYIAFGDIKQSYEYLNIVLDTANFGKQRFGYKILKEEFDGRNIKKR
ncbi:MAG: hypothetical protein COT16_03825 [Elusimicrobia bacterium CG08_land_8_20_14_0_20_44_26]|nr:MAG: hypothetical protein COT16_03825 [Elusimicrobia bacterium CG08_land_8_20_14_0_20_44_26]